MQLITPRPSPAYHFGQVVVIESKTNYKNLTADVVTTAVIIGCFLHKPSTGNHGLQFIYFLSTIEGLQNSAVTCVSERDQFLEKEITKAVGVYHFSSHHIEYYPTT